MKLFVITMLMELFCFKSVYSKQIVPDTISTQQTITVYTRPVQGIVVSSTGSLTLKPLSRVTIKGPFEVKIGGRLDIKRQSRVSVIYVYDQSGNRTARRTEDEE